MGLGCLMYRCESCYALVPKDEAEMGLCPKCSRDSLVEIEFSCPECGKDMGEPTSVDIGRIGWGCTNCRIKVYKEIE